MPATASCPILILSLPGDEARRAPLLERLAALGLDYEVVLGVDGRKGLPADLEREVDREAVLRNSRRALTDGELACALSHRRACQTVLDRGWQAAVILEDDAVVSERLRDFIRAGGATRWPMTLLDYSRISVARGSGTEICPGLRAHRVMFNATLNTGYSVSRAAAQVLVSAASPVRGRADWPCDLHGLSAVAIHPRPVDHPPEGTLSHLEQERAKLERKVAGKPAGRYLSLGYWRGTLRKKRAVRLDP